MAKVNPKYVPGWKGHLELDGESLSIMGRSSDDSVEALDVTVDTDNGFSRKEAGIHTVKVTFSVPLEATATESPIDVGGIYPMVFTINTTPKYDGDFTVLSANVKADFKGVIQLDVTAECYGDVTPVVTP